MIRNYSFRDWVSITFISFYHPRIKFSHFNVISFFFPVWIEFLINICVLLCVIHLTAQLVRWYKGETCLLIHTDSILFFYLQFFLSRKKPIFYKQCDYSGHRCIVFGIVFFFFTKTKSTMDRSPQISQIRGAIRLELNFTLSTKFIRMRILWLYIFRYQYSLTINTIRSNKFEVLRLVWIVQPREFQSRTGWPTIRTSSLCWIDFVHPVLSVISSKSCFFEMDLS